MNATTKQKLRYAGSTLLNLLVVLLAIGGVQAGLHAVHMTATPALGMLGAITAVAYIAGVRWIERREVTELSLTQLWREFPAGVAMGCGLFAAVMLMLRLGGAYRIEGWGDTGAVASGLAMGISAAVVEEILFRGILFRLLEAVFGWWVALGLTSALFGAAHAANRGATVWSSVAIALEAGILLGSAYALTRRLWVPMGIHLGWNFTEGTVFGMAVSGNEVSHPLVRGTISGGALLTGGKFGPEASLPAVMACVTVAAVLLAMTMRSRRTGS